MNLEKSRLKMLMAKDMCRELEEKLQSVEKMAVQQEGAKSGLKLAAKGIADLMKLVDSEFSESGTIGGFKPEELGGEPLRMMGVVKRWIQRAIGCVDNLATTAEVVGISEGGKVKGIRDSIAIVKKTYDEERAKLEMVEKGIANGTIVIEDGQLTQKDISRDNPRIVGMPPGPTLKDQRNSEADTEAKAKEETPQEPIPEIPEKKKKQRKSKGENARNNT